MAKLTKNEKRLRKALRRFNCLIDPGMLGEKVIARINEALPGVIRVSDGGTLYLKGIDGCDPREKDYRLYYKDATPPRIAQSNAEDMADNLRTAVEELYRLFGEDEVGTMQSSEDVRAAIAHAFRPYFNLEEDDNEAELPDTAETKTEVDETDLSDLKQKLEAFHDMLTAKWAAYLEDDRNMPGRDEVAIILGEYRTIFGFRSPQMPEAATPEEDFAAQTEELRKTARQLIREKLDNTADGDQLSITVKREKN